MQPFLTQPLHKAVQQCPQAPALSFGELNFFSGIAIQGETRDHGMFQARTDGGFCLVEVAAGNFSFIRRGANEYAVDVNEGARGHAGDAQFIGKGLCGKKRARGEN